MTDVRQPEVVESADELEDLFRGWEGGPLRLVGSGSRQWRLPPPPAGARSVELRGMRRIDRLEPDDLTCSVEPGLPRAELDRELQEHGIELPCPGGGTVGGLFAADPHGPLAPGGPSPRSLLLGLEGLLSDGTRFRSGARVVKSVAGYDLHKLFVGSRGRLFAATLLHLKLRKVPRSRHRFANRELDRGRALDLFRSLRSEPATVAALMLVRGSGGFEVAGRLDGRPEAIATLRDRHALRESEAEASLQLRPEDGEVVITGGIRASRLPLLLDAVPETAPLSVTGAGRFEVALDRRDAEELLERLPSIPAGGEIVAGDPASRGRSTPLDSGAARLEHELKRALDPAGVLT